MCIRDRGCTYTALSEVAAPLQKHEIETEIFWIGNQPIRGCIDCRSCWGKGRCVFDDDSVNQCIQKSIQADGLVVVDVYKRQMYNHPQACPQ